MSTIINAIRLATDSRTVDIDAPATPQFNMRTINGVSTAFTGTLNIVHKDIIPIDHSTFRKLARTPANIMTGEPMANGRI
ncbi:MAG: hypothetical protein IJT54_08335 [Candidatus Methanomethylophilaceae archaeon]|nr:hypothetical protein [Candidatus Methanomethylophilaceae archaeon]